MHVEDKICGTAVEISDSEEGGSGSIGYEGGGGCIVATGEEKYRGGGAGFADSGNSGLDGGGPGGYAG